MRSTPSWLALALLAALSLSCNDAAPNSDSGKPLQLWSRDLGPGYSGIVAREGRLYTMYRSGSSEVAVCLDARTGETVWEHRYESTPVEGQDTDYGEGPNAAPLLTGGRLYTIGFTGVMHALDAKTGEVIWSRDLRSELGATVIELGYSSTPVEYKETVIALVGGPGQGAVAFDKQDGRVVWKNLDFTPSYATPAIMSIHGEEQLVAFMETEIVGADPANGKLLWEYGIRNYYPQNICAPVQVDDDLLFVSTFEAGSRGLRLVRDGAFRVEEAWSTTRIQCFYGTFAMLEGIIYGTSGLASGPRMSAIDARTGEIVWRARGYRLSHVVAFGDGLVLLDDEGKLTVATPGPGDLTVHSETSILSSPALTPPTLDGTVLYLRDQRRVVALDLGGVPCGPDARGSLRGTCLRTAGSLPS